MKCAANKSIVYQLDTPNVSSVKDYKGKVEN